jgi:methionine-rich copper-binding protein CopC
MPIMKRSSTLVSLAAAMAVTLAAPAIAHTRLVASSPAANATLRTGPTTITLTFNERLVAAFSKFELTMPAHDMKVPVRTALSSDGKRLVGTLERPLTKGSYRVAWTAAGADGHRMTGEVAFTVS